MDVQRTRNKNFMKIAHTPEHDMERLDLIEGQFYPAAVEFGIALARDRRANSRNAGLLREKTEAVARVDAILDQWLDLRRMIGLATPLEPAQPLTGH